MIQGIGSDLVEIARIEAAYQRRGEALAQRLLSASEWQRFLAEGRKMAFLAKRFAAKEALLKALGTGLRNIRWQDISIENDSLGKPVLVAQGVLAARLQGCQVHISITDERAYALAFVIIESTS